MSTATIAPPTVHYRHFTVDEFARMIDAGIIGPEERLELLDGGFICMAAIGVRHFRAVTALCELLWEKARSTALISVQSPIQLNDESAPQPDIAVLRRREYESLATPEDVFFLVEVADSSRTYDRDVKFPYYAAAGISEAWLVDLIANVIERHSDPREGRYCQIFVAGISDTISSTVLPDLAFPVTAVIGPPGQR
jgi:Uma2 family endonuclease